MKILPSGKLIIDVYLKVFNGVNVPDISFRVQENIKNNISSMVEMKTGKINIHVVGVDFVTPTDEVNQLVWENKQEKLLLKLYIKAYF